MEVKGFEKSHTIQKTEENFERNTSVKVNKKGGLENAQQKKSNFLFSYKKWSELKSKNSTMKSKTKHDKLIKLVDEQASQEHGERRFTSAVLLYQ